MKKFNYTTFIFIALLFAVSFSTVKAQEETPAPAAPNQTADKKPRPNLLAELGLSPEQIEQIKRINQESKPQMRQAQQRFQAAKRNLDEAIYADANDESNVQARLKEAQAAQAEVFKIRSMTELAVRKVLTAEQLVKFRELRQKFMEGLENRLKQPRNRQTNNPNNPNNPNKRLNKMQRNLPPNN